MFKQLQADMFDFMRNILFSGQFFNMLLNHAEELTLFLYIADMITPARPETR